jgi:membrane-associated protein
MAISQETFSQGAKFYERHGKKTIVIARFMPIVRTLHRSLPGSEPCITELFFAYNLVGGFVWTVGLTLLGYSLGSLIPAEQVDKYLLPIIGLIIVVSITPSIIHLIQENKSSRR